MKKKPTKSKAKVLLVDDHVVVRDGLAQLIRGEPDLDVCGEAASAEEAIAAVTRLNPDLAIVDISLGGANGIELIKNIKAVRPALPMLVLSMHDESHYAERALRAGASGYVMKREARDRIMEAIRTVLSGRDYVSERMQKSIVHCYLHGTGKETSPIQRLSDREVEVLTLLGKGLGSKDIANRLHLSQKTVDSHRTHLRGKLNLSSAPELVRFAFEWVHSQESA
ncbi:MAG: response regulator transcription factor [Verrucomicrobiota bacterium]|nr:response regulator transcription factor [Verrucomicrobiota bacterium]